MMIYLTFVWIVKIIKGKEHKVILIIFVWLTRGKERKRFIMIFFTIMTFL